MRHEQKIVSDGFVALLGGIDSSRSPSLISADQAAWAGNCDFRDGIPKTRPRFFQQPLVYPNDEVAAYMEEHAVQGTTVFSPRHRNAVIIVSIGGRIFEIDVLAGNTVKEITPHSITTTSASFTAPAFDDDVTVQVVDATIVQPGFPIEINGGRYLVLSVSGSTLTLTNLTAEPGVVAAGATVMVLDPNSPTNPRAWMQQAEIFLIIQDGQRRPIIYDGSKSWRSDITKQQVPTGEEMAYGKGRLWVAVNKTEFVAGDIVGGQEHDTSYPNRVDSVLYFTENTFLAGGGAFSVPLQSGEITAMIFMAVLDTSTGNGPLLIFTERAVFSCDASEDRATWGNTRSPIKTIVIVGSGAVGHYAVAQTTNSDIFYRSRDGVRSFYLAMRQFTASWGNTPNSTEMDRILPYDDPLLIKYGSMIQFDNRLLFTVQPLPTQVNAYHRGIGVLDFNLISSMRGKAPPAYSGVWSGFQPVLLFKGDIGGRERAFAWARNSAEKNELWEFDKVSGFDNEDARVSSFLESRSMFGRGLGDSPLTIKRLESVEIYLDDVKGTVDFTLYYKPDQYPCWIEWGRVQSVCSEYQTCDEDSTGACADPVVKRPTFKTRLNFGQPTDTDLGVDDKPARMCYEAQLRLAWVGHCRIRKVLVRFLQRDDEMSPPVS